MLLRKINLKNEQLSCLRSQVKQLREKLSDGKGESKDEEPKDDDDEIKDSDIEAQLYRLNLEMELFGCVDEPEPEVKCRSVRRKVVDEVAQVAALAAEVDLELEESALAKAFKKGKGGGDKQVAEVSALPKVEVDVESEAATDIDDKDPDIVDV